MTKKQIKLTKNGKNELIMTKNEENQNDGFRVFYNKKESKCQQTLKPNTGDYCVYCSYGTVPCPPIQENES